MLGLSVWADIMIDLLYCVCQCVLSYIVLLFEPISLMLVYGLTKVTDEV